MPVILKTNIIAPEDYFYKNLERCAFHMQKLVSNQIVRDRAKKSKIDRYCYMQAAEINSTDVL
jgi:hypothetical protein